MLNTCPGLALFLSFCLIKRIVNDRFSICDIWSILDKNPFSCLTCDFKAPSQSKFARHMCKFAEQQSLECSLCKLKFNSGLQLRKHLKKVHNQYEDIAQKGNKNDLRDFLQSMKIPQTTKYSTDLPPILFKLLKWKSATFFYRMRCHCTILNS